MKSLSKKFHLSTLDYRLRHVLDYFVWCLLRGKWWVLHPSRIREFNPYNRDYPVHYVVDCLIWHLCKKQNPLFFGIAVPVLSARNTPAQWYTYSVVDSVRAYEFCCKTLALANGAKINEKSVAPLFKKSNMSLEDRELIIAKTIQESLSNQGVTLRKFLETSYKPWVEAILKAIK